MRNFDTGATRDDDSTKYDFEGFLSPLVLERFGQYMHSHRTQADGKVRDSDNWQKGIPQDAYMKSGWRHFFDWWWIHRGCETWIAEKLEETLCALMFNTMGYLHEHLKGQSRHDDAKSVAIGDGEIPHTLNCQCNSCASARAVDLAHRERANTDKQWRQPTS